MKDLENDLVRREAELLALGDTYVDFGHHIERLVAQRANIAQNMEAKQLL